MKKFGLLAVAMLGILALPGSALAQRSDCSYVDPAGVVASQGGLVVYTGDGTTTDSIAGACLDLASPVTAGPISFDGGTVEVGGSGSEAYAVVDGDNENQDPQGSGDGYGGASNYDSDGTAGSDPCPDQSPYPDDTGSGTNSGGCLSLRSGTTYLASVGVPLVICGNTTGNDWEASQRDGCTLP